MKAPFSEYLNELAPGLKKLVGILNASYDYVSILATDSVGLTVMISQHAKAVGSSTMTTERGIVVRVHTNHHYSEYALNDFDPARPEEAAAKIIRVLKDQETVLQHDNCTFYETDILPDEPYTLFVEKETEQLPETTDVKALVEEFCGISDAIMKCAEDAVEGQVAAQSTHISKMFLSRNRDLRQSYVYSEGAMSAVVAKDGRSDYSYDGVSGLCGPELFSQMKGRVEKVCADAETILSAERIEPGTYDIITSPEVTGLIAHEAFGHGVEMDQFVKGRALGAEYINKRVGSDMTTMHEGALCVQNVTTYAFDDEGVLAGDVTEIDHGILKTGICDALSALRLHTQPTGNGKRENFEHKVYTRMTNTIFDSGKDNVEDMIKSIKHGYLLEGMESGMEDPKHWGIQCVIKMGREIKDGKLTGKVVAPVLMTGYVPDLLGSISMVSTDREVFGNGGCGKGHKEWVKVADGGPYLKTKGVLA